MEANPSETTKKNTIFGVLFVATMLTCGLIGYLLRHPEPPTADINQQRENDSLRQVVKKDAIWKDSIYKYAAGQIEIKKHENDLIEQVKKALYQQTNKNDENIKNIADSRMQRYTDSTVLLPTFGQ